MALMMRGAQFALCRLDSIRHQRRCTGMTSLVAEGVAQLLNGPVLVFGCILLLMGCQKFINNLRLQSNKLLYFLLFPFIPNFW